jgi:cob(I)alamin adenosyltransferase
MVKLDRIYTRGGDKGETSLADGTRLAKHSLRIHAQGEIDEAHAAIGLARLHAAGSELDPMLARVQNDLFDIGADITTPWNESATGQLRVAAAQVARLEREADRLNAKLPPLTTFVLRGGTPAGAHLHFACTVVRRAERAVSALTAAEPVNAQILIYLNRLSDLLFVMARTANDHGKADVAWRPGLTAAGGEPPP